MTQLDQLRRLKERQAEERAARIAYDDDMSDANHYRWRKVAEQFEYAARNAQLDQWLAEWEGDKRELAVLKANASKSVVKRIEIMTNTNPAAAREE